MTKEIQEKLDIIDRAETIDNKTMKILMDRVAKVKSGEIKVVLVGENKPC